MRKYIYMIKKKLYYSAEERRRLKNYKKDTILCGPLIY
jgi:hypothetical protein